ncbi:MAG: lipoyl synthase, partial [Hydrogenothermaceae bacterium]
MIMGDICTRNCPYCNVSHGKPLPLDREEPIKIAKAVKTLGLKYVVITSVDRDDLEDGGSSHFAEVVYRIREISENIKIELLIPDFKGNEKALKTVIQSKPDVINHNIETVKFLYKKVRPQGNYERSINLLKSIKNIESDIKTKSGLMVGLGESFEEILELFNDLKEANVDIITIGQYLQPSKNHLSVEKYYSDEEFDILKEEAMKIGFKEVFSGKLVRSSY